MKKVYFTLFFICTHLFLSASDIVVVTAAIGEKFQESVQDAIKNKQDYCNKHGYDFVCLDHSLDTSRHPAWSKIKIIQQLLSTDQYQWVFWTDADALFMNFAIKLEELVDENFDFIVSKDHHVHNTGHFLLKNSSWSRNFLNEIYNKTHCINHLWWENQAVIELLAEKQYLERTKTIPQRLFNSYPEIPEYTIELPSTSAFQEGDFIVHFASLRNPDLFKHYLKIYSAQAIDDRDIISLDDYLHIYNFFLKPLHSNINEGYVTKEQKDQFTQRLAEYTNIQDILEIGFNAGHSAEIFLTSLPEASLTSVDINQHPYTKVGLEYCQRQFNERFRFYQGDSRRVVPMLATAFPNKKFDLIFLDGGCNFDCFYADIKNCRRIATQDTILWIDDYNAPGASEAIDKCVSENIIKILRIHPSKDPNGHRLWVEAKYI